jgi:hypothetical protein
LNHQAAYLYGAIIACEAAFWLVLVVALAARYLWRRKQLSRTLLLALPVVDLLLLVFTAFDLRSGTTADFAHGLATAYVGFTIAFGGILVAWADQRFAHRFAGGPAPSPAPDRGWPAVRHEFGLWLRSVVAWLITLSLLLALIAFIDDAARTEALEQWFRFAFGGVILWFVFGPAWSLVFFRREKMN